MQIRSPSPGASPSSIGAPPDRRPAGSGSPGASTFVRSPAAGTTGASAKDRGNLPPRIQHDISDVMDLVQRVLRPGGAATISVEGRPMTLSRAKTGQGVALQTPHDYDAGNRIGLFMDKDADFESTLEVDGEDITYGNPKLRAAYGTVQSLVMDFSLGRTYF